MTQARTVRDIARRIPANLIFDDTAARDAFFSGVSLTGGEICAIRDGANGQINQTYDADLPGWRSTGTGGGSTSDTWRDATGATPDPGYSAIARHGTDIIINGHTAGRGGNTSSSTNTAFGDEVLAAAGGGSSVLNTGFGFEVLKRLISGNNNCGFGTLALTFLDGGSSNCAFGPSALRFLSNGSNNSAFGNSALRNTTDGQSNTAFGTLSMNDNGTGDSNSAFGGSSLRRAVDGNSNTAFGVDALTNLLTDDFNTAAGRAAGTTQTGGNYNSYLGAFAGSGIATGNNNTVLGARADGLPAALSDTVILADGAGVEALRKISTGEVGLAGVTDPTESVDASGTIRLRNAPSNDSGGNSIKRIFLQSDTGVVTGQYNVEGQVKLNNAGGVKPSLTNFTANQPKYFLYNGGALGFSGSPTTQWPSNILAPVDADFVRPTTFALLENPIEGQVHIWRILYSYEFKGTNANLGIVVGLVNGDNAASTFVTSQNQSAPSGTQETPTFDFSIAQPGITNPNRVVYEQVTLLTIADSASIGTGYRLFAGTTQSDGNLRITIESVTRSTLQKVIR